MNEFVCPCRHDMELEETMSGGWSCEMCGKEVQFKLLVDDDNFVYRKEI